MELSLLPLQQSAPTLLSNPSPLSFFSINTGKRCTNRKSSVLPCRCTSSVAGENTVKVLVALNHHSRRAVMMGCFLASAAGIYACDFAGAATTSRRALKGSKIPESEYTTLANGLKYYDIKVGGGTTAVKGSRVAVHYVAKWKGITFMTSRQGLGVGGGTPYGFDVGESERGRVLKGLDLGVQGMRVGAIAISPS